MRMHRPACGVFVLFIALGVSAFPARAERPATRPAGDADGSRLKWAAVCRLRVVDGRLVVETGLNTEVLRRAGADRFGPQQVNVDGLPGETSLCLGPQRFYIRNAATVGERRMTAIVYVLPSQTTIDATDRPDGGTRYRSVRLSQAGPRTTRKDMRPGEVRFTINGDGVPNESLTLAAPDFAALRTNYPHETNRYLRPVLRHLRSDLLDVDPNVMRQVLELDGAGTTGGVTAAATADDGATAVEVGRHVARLGAAGYAEREAAAARLAELGPRAHAALRRLDRDRLSPEQNLAIDRLLKGGPAGRVLSPDELRRLRDDPHFLADCLYTDSPAARQAVAGRLARLIGRNGGDGGATAGLNPLLTDAAAGWDVRAAAIEELRVELVPPTKKESIEE